MVVGGQADGALVTATEVFDGASWTDAAPIPTPRNVLAAATDGAYLYALGDRNLSADKNTSAAERFDPATGRWVTLPDMPTPRGGLGATYLDGRIVAVGGEEPTRVLGDVQVYDIDSGTWSTSPPLGVARHGMTVVTVGATMFAVNGASRPTHTESAATGEALDFS
ncbi:MAG: hypothetical protein BGP03_00025 [Pseudonocardia sp. 73-21]|nr:MAG: hypothetical protein BGP03_00025 [Pseudonocardia sp. 73-21]